MRTFEFHTLDVFTDRIFGGNPLAVFPDATGLDEHTMQRIARELNLSETVFVLPPEEGGDARLRIFTPGREVPFAGHPTVGTAVLLVGQGRIGSREDGTHRVVLEEGVGPVPVDVEVRDGEVGRATLTAAARPTETPFHGTLDDCAEMLGLEAAELEVHGGLDGWSALGDLVRPPLRPSWASVGLDFFVVPVRDRDACTRAVLDARVRDRVVPPGSPSTMIYVVAPGDGDADLHVRMFAPEIGVPEDPATGSACAALGGWLGTRLPEGAYRWTVVQGIEMGRPSRLELEVDVGQGGVDRVRVGGGAVRVTKGEMRVP